MQFSRPGSDHRRNKSVSPPWNRFHIPRRASIIIQCLAYSIYGLVQRLLEVNERIVSPDLLLQLLSRNDLAWPLRQGRQNAERLLLQPDRQAMLTQLHGIAVQFVNAEVDLARHPGYTPCRVLYRKNRFTTFPRLGYTRPDLNLTQE